MPVYNAESFLRRALDSLCAQTLQEWELICVDDGSTDASGRIIEEYASCDNRIRVIHQSNSGVAMARQAGVDAALGEYIIHADSDDWVDPTMLEELYRKAKEEDADVVLCDYYVNDQNGQRLIKQQPTQLTSKQVLHDLFHRLHGGLWNKLIRRNKFLEHDIKFPAGINYCEDRFVIMSLYCNDIRTAYLARAFYHYYSNPDSITRSYSRRQYDEQQAFLEGIERLLPNEEYQHLIQKERFEAFLEGFIFNVLSEDEIIEASKQFSELAFSCLGLRRRVGFVMIQFGLYKLAHKFIRY